MEFREILYRAEEKIETEKEGGLTEAELQRAKISHMRIPDQNGRETAAAAEGALAAEHNLFWRREDLKFVQIKNERSFFRLETDLDVKIVPLGSLGLPEEEAKLLNISAGGVSIGTRYECCQEERLLLKVRLLPECQEWNLFCRVLRAEKKGISGFVYGCQFMELGDAERDELMQAILELQRRMRGMKV